MELFKDISIFFASIAAIVTSIAALYGINTWKRKRTAEFAEEVLTLFYQAENAIKNIRSPFARADEGNIRKVENIESEKDKNAKNQAYVPIERINEHRELFAKIHSIRFRFMASFGRDNIKAFNEFDIIVNDIIIAAQMLSKLYTKKETSFRTEQIEDKHYEDIDNYQKVIWVGFSDDPIKPKLDKMIFDIESICRPKIEQISWFKKWKKYVDEVGEKNSKIE